MAALSGSLKEFQVADIFQLIAQQHKSGELVLTHEGRKGSIVFKEGMIISAANNTTTVIQLMTNYLVAVRGYPKERITELISYCKDSQRHFTDVLLRIQYLTEQEVQFLARSGIEDIACELFGWERGTYRFTPLTQIDDTLIRDIKLPPDSVTMEAMRRLDEWQRMRAHITPETVFASLSQSLPSSPSGGHGLEEAAHAFIYGRIDGVSSVEELCRKTFLTTYRVYEILYDFLSQGFIRPVALKRYESPQRQQSSDSGFPALVGIIPPMILVGMFFLGMVILPRTIFHESYHTARETRTAVHRGYAKQKTRIAELNYRSLFHEEPVSSDVLVSSHILAKRDLAE